MISATNQQTIDKVLAEEGSSALNQLIVCQYDVVTLIETTNRKIANVKQKYNNLLKSFCEERNDVILNHIPSFWVRTLMNHPVICGILNEEDEECLQFLCDLEVEEFADTKMGYRIRFHFDKNPYFENMILTKELRLAGQGGMSSNSTPITWKEGKDLLKAVEQSTGPKSRLKYQSFFAWFVDNSDPLNDDIAEIFKDDVWPNPLMHFDADNNFESDEDEKENEFAGGEQVEGEGE